MNIEQLLYLGPWYDFKPIIHFNNVKKFIYIDTQPRSEFDDFTKNIFYPEFYKNNFVIELMLKLKLLGFRIIRNKKYTYCLDNSYKISLDTSNSEVQSVDKTNRIKNNLYSFVNPWLFTFYNPSNGKIIKYYVSTNIQFNMCNQLKLDIETSDGLIYSGYVPNKILLNYIIKPINFYGYKDSCYKIDELNDDDNILQFISKNDYSKYFSNLFFVNNNGSIYKLLNYSDFINHKDLIL